MNAVIETIGKVNGVDITISINGEKLVPIKPICEALGVDSEAQRQKILEDPILGSTTVLSKAVGKDGKQREMQCLPLKYALGWLFRIDSRNVKEAAKEAVLEYQMMCYDVLYDYFSGYADFVEIKQARVQDYIKRREEAQRNFSTARDTLKGIEKSLKETLDVTYQTYRAADGQIDLFEQ